MSFLIGWAIDKALNDLLRWVVSILSGLKLLGIKIIKSNIKLPKTNSRKSNDDIKLYMSFCTLLPVYFHNYSINFSI